MGIWIGDLLRCYDGTSYEVGAFLDRVGSREGGRTLYNTCLLPMLGDPSNPDDWITVQVIVAGDIVLCPYDWQSDPDAYRLDIPEYHWVEMATGALCVMIDGWPYLPAMLGAPEERPISGDD